MSRKILQEIIDDFKAEDFTRFFRANNDKFQHLNQFLHYKDDNFGDGKKLEEITFEDGNLIVCSFQAKQSLSERFGKKAQYELGKKILKETQTDAGIFIFYDKSGTFRFSLIYANYLGRRRDWSTFRRFTYFVSKELTNKTFLQRIGDGDFSSLAKIKEAFSVEKVTKEFYEDIANWYFWAVDHCRFPKDAEAEVNGRNVAVIRLITRMIFIWFMRERGLVPKELFEEKNTQAALKETDPNSATYYRAILQNLFFATLSTKKDERQFRDERRVNRGWNKDFGNQYVFRYHDLFREPGKIKDYFDNIPFLNGGLFECLDDGRSDIYIDGFTERKEEYQPQVPNFLFFSGEKKADLNSFYGTKGKSYKVRGLLNILSSFNFAIDENSPDDADIALDPELLGRVFENLLASFNPETSTTARKATGSYYTPREIVDYMVTESLKEYFKTHLANVQDIDKKLETLFATGSDESPLNKTESRKLVRLIESVRIIDPAVGSGAFPMGALNKMVFILNKVDPGNELWKQAQLEAAEAIPDPQVRRNTKKQIEEFFKDKNADYGRKLYLIQKCIYGVDIQQIAVEIAKLRFFISLLVDEKIDKEKENWGIEPLPNLDFKIMQGNSLISEFLGIDFDDGAEQEKTAQAGMFTDKEGDGLIKEFEQKKIEFQNEADKDRKSKLKTEVEDLMIKIFETKVKKQKEDYFRKLEEIENNPFLAGMSKKSREEAVARAKQKLSKKAGFDLENIEKQLREFMSKNKAKPFFPWKLYFAEVFSEKGGFDVVIANPPYLSHDKIPNKKLIEEKFKTYAAFADLYCYFLEVALNIQNPRGLLCYITSNSYMKAEYGKPLRDLLLEKNRIIFIINIEEFQVFDSAIVNTAVLLAGRPQRQREAQCLIVNAKYTGEDLFETFVEKNKFLYSQNNLHSTSWYLLSPVQLTLKKKIEAAGKTLEKLGTKIRLGIATGANDAFVINGARKKELIETDSRSARIIKPVLRGRDIFRYKYQLHDQYIILAANGIDVRREYPAIFKHLDSFGEAFKKRGAQGVHWFNLRPTAFLEDFKRTKIIWIELTDSGRFALCQEEIYLLNSAYFLIPPEQFNTKYLLAVLNSRIIQFYLGCIAETSGMGVTRWINNYVKDIPIPVAHIGEQNKYADLVDKILAITKDDNYLENPAKQAKVREYEKQIDKLVYKLYGLTAEEIKIVEKS